MTVVDQMVLHDLCLRSLRALDAHESVAEDVAFALVESSLCGVDTHGVNLLPKIVARVRAGRSQVVTPCRSVSTVGALHFLDAGGTPGQHATMEAVRRAAGAAKESGVGLAIVDHSTHFGGCVPFLRALEEHEMVGVVGSNSLRSMAAFGSRRANLGNNPFGFVLPGVERSFVFDTSAAVMSFGRRAQLLSQGEPVPAGAFVRQPDEPDANGVAEVADSLDHLAVPFGQHKGASVAVLVEALAALLSGGNYGRATETMAGERFLGPSHFVLAIDPSAGPSGAGFRERVSDYLESMRRDESVRLPGERLHATREARVASGVPLDPPVADSLRECADELGVESW